MIFRFIISRYSHTGLVFVSNKFTDVYFSVSLQRLAFGVNLTVGQRVIFMRLVERRCVEVSLLQYSLFKGKSWRITVFSLTLLIHKLGSNR